MLRRDFLKQSSTVAALASLPLACYSVPSASRYAMGLQLFTVRDAMEKDVIGTLKALKEMGYLHFESYGYDAEAKTYYGYDPETFKTILSDLGLRTTSGHYGMASMLQATEKEQSAYIKSCIEGATRLGDPYIVFPMLPEAYHSAEGYAQLVKKLNQMGRQIAAAGLGFAYHNFGFDFDIYDGRTGLDWVIEETNPDWVKLEVDFYWLMRAGVTTPEELVDKAPGRIPLWHIKDMHKETKDYTELGNGSIDYTKILPDPIRSGLKWFYIEQGGNFAETSMKSAETSSNFFKANLKTYL
jgi:sugar phosphate isomerase/epimerase